MTKRSYQNKWDSDIVYCQGIKMPIASIIEFMFFEHLKQKIKEEQKKVFSFDEVFDGYTHSKKSRFDLISRLIKKKFIKMEKVDDKNYLFEIIMNESYKECTEMKIYRPKTRRERFEIIRYLNQ